MKRFWGQLDGLWLGPADPRTYALLRIVFAIVALINLADLWPHRHAFFAETGVIDLPTVLRAIGNQPYYSVFHHVSSESGVTACFIITAGALACLGLGIVPRIAAIVAFAWHLSYTYRAFPVMHGWDTALRVFSFYMMLAPLGCWRLWPRGVGRSEAVASLGPPRYGLILFRIQLFVIYWQSVWLKLDDEYWRNGEFFSYFMMSLYSRFPSPAWADWLVLSNAATFGTLVIEVCVPVLLCLSRTRLLGFALGVSLHLGILLLSTIYVFSLVALIPYFAFLSGKNMDQLSSVVRRRLGHVALLSKIVSRSPSPAGPSKLRIPSA